MMFSPLAFYPVDAVYNPYEVDVEMLPGRHYRHGDRDRDRHQHQQQQQHLQPGWRHAQPQPLRQQYPRKSHHHEYAAPFPEEQLFSGYRYEDGDEYSDDVDEYDDYHRYANTNYRDELIRQRLAQQQYLLRQQQLQRQREEEEAERRRRHRIVMEQERLRQIEAEKQRQLLEKQRLAHLHQQQQQQQQRQQRPQRQQRQAQPRFQHYGNDRVFNPGQVHPLFGAYGYPMSEFISNDNEYQDEDENEEQLEDACQQQQQQQQHQQQAQEQQPSLSSSPSSSSSVPNSIPIPIAVQVNNEKRHRQAVVHYTPEQQDAAARTITRALRRGIVRLQAAKARPRFAQLAKIRAELTAVQESIQRLQVSSSSSSSESVDSADNLKAFNKLILELEERLTRVLLGADTVVSDGFDSVRLARKLLIRSAELALARLDEIKKARIARQQQEQQLEEKMQHQQEQERQPAVEAAAAEGQASQDTDEQPINVEATAVTPTPTPTTAMEIATENHHVDLEPPKDQGIIDKDAAQLEVDQLDMDVNPAAESSASASVEPTQEVVSRDNGNEQVDQNEEDESKNKSEHEDQDGWFFLPASTASQAEADATDRDVVRPVHDDPGCEAAAHDHPPTEASGGTCPSESAEPSPSTPATATALDQSGQEENAGQASADASQSQPEQQGSLPASSTVADPQSEVVSSMLASTIDSDEDLFDAF